MSSACNCCESIPPVISFEIESKIGVCSGCGVEGGGENRSVTFAETNCTKGGTINSRINVAYISELIYSSLKLTDNFGARLKISPTCFPSHVTQRIHTCDLGSSCDPCYPAFSFGSQCCEDEYIGGSSCCTGASRPTVALLSNPVNSCNLDFTDWTSDTSSIPSNVVSSHNVSVYGNNRTKTISRFRIKNHQPTITCYLKIWFRKKIITRYIISKTQPIYGPEQITYEDIPYTYEWEGTGNPCFEDETKTYNHPDNLVENEDSEFIEFETDFLPNEDSLEAFDDWSLALSESTTTDLGDAEELSWGANLPQITEGPPFIGGIATAYLEYKYSFVKDLEPEWGENVPKLL